MTMITNVADCRNTHFERKEALNIRGEPTFEQLQKLYENIKINAQSVPSTLGGGQHGHLGLVITPNEYQMLSLTPFYRPVNPGPFTLTQQQLLNMTPDQRNELRQLHSDALTEFHQVKQVEGALKQYITESIEEEYLYELCNETTKKLEDTIPQIMLHLFGTYGNLTTQTLVEKQAQLLSYNYDVTKPIDTVFNLAKEFQDYSALFGTTQPADHIINLCYNILRKTGKFRGALEKWNEKAPQDKTWTNFKLHFRRASKNLREFSVDTAAQAGYSQQMVNEITNGLYNMMSTQEDESQEQAENFMNNMANAVQQNQNILPQILQTMTTMQDNINALNNANSNRNQQQRGSNNNNNNNNRNNQQQQMQQFHPQQFAQQPPQFQQMPFPYCMPTNQFQQMPYMPMYQQNSQSNRGGGRNYRRNNRNNNNNYGNSSNYGNNNNNSGGGRRGQHYCWSHGSCSHPSSQCRNPRPGHMWNATYYNRMNGSIEGCE